MCGIAGIIYKTSGYDEKEIVNMTDIIKHRGPDGEGHYYASKLAFGHRRLAILDLSEKGKQPMEYLDRYIITYNGEIYNYIEIRKELENNNYRFYSDTDTEVVMASFDFWGKECLHKFNGMWSFAIYDKVKNCVFCARDRYGVKPFYYTQLKNKFVFASEIKQFTVLGGWNSVVNINRFTDSFLLEGMHDHTNQTLFKDVFQLLGGECLSYNLNSNDYLVIRWYDLRKQVKKYKKTFNQAKNEFKVLFTDTVYLRLRSDVKVGSCLSGGLDSSSIVCVMNDILKKDNKANLQETVSACYNVKDIDESEYIDTVIDERGILSHKVYPHFNTLIQKIEDIVWHQDEPFGSTSIYAQWCVYEEARKNGIIVLLDGQGADEYLAGYSSFHKVYFRELLLKFKWIKLIKAMKNYKAEYNAYYFSPYRDLMETAIGALISNNAMRIIVNKISKKRNNEDKFFKTEKLYDDNKFNQCNKYAKNIRSESINQILYTGLVKLLHHQDRNSMAHSVESRTPFMDYRLVEFVLSLPCEYKINNAITKFVMREGLKGVLPEKIENRKDKLGFTTPQQVWIKNNAEEYRAKLTECSDILSDYVKKDVVLKEFDMQIEKNLPVSGKFWTIICTGIWVKVFKVKF